MGEGACYRKFCRVLHAIYVDLGIHVSRKYYVVERISETKTSTSRPKSSDPSSPAAVIPHPSPQTNRRIETNTHPATRSHLHRHRSRPRTSRRRFALTAMGPAALHTGQRPCLPGEHRRRGPTVRKTRIHGRREHLHGAGREGGRRVGGV